VTSKPVKDLEDPNANKIWKKEELEAQPPERIRAIFHGGSPHVPTNVYTELRDGANFINNSKNPNIEVVFNNIAEKEYTIALRDSEAIEELTENYEMEKPNEMPWVDELMQKYCKTRWEQDNAK
jgi:SET domain-containing protein